MDQQVEKQLRELIGAMQKTDAYQRYRHLEEKLEEQPDLKKELDAYRLCVYNLQVNHVDVYDRIDSLGQQYKDLRINPLTNEFLETETEVCRMLQDVFNAISANVPVDVPRE